MVVAAIVGLGLGITGGVMLGEQLFKGHRDFKKFNHLDVEADRDDNVPEPFQPSGSVSPEYRNLLQYAPKWVTWPDFEQVNWMNSIVEWLWPHLTAGITKMVKEMVGPILEDVVKQQALLDAVVIETFDLGKIPVQLAGIKVYDTKDDEVILEVPIVWGSSAKFEVSACVRLGPVSIYVPVKVENVLMRATARITIRPLVDTLPCMGAVSISLTEAPFVDLSIALINKLDFMALPFVHSGLLNVIKMVTDQMVVYPNQIEVPLMENSGRPTPPSGMLEFTIERISNLSGKADLVGKGDPYVMVFIQFMSQIEDGSWVVRYEGPSQRTTIKSNTSNPEYNEGFRLLVPELTKNHVLVFRVMDYDLIGSDSSMCEHRIPLDKDDSNNEFLRVTDDSFNKKLTLLAPQGKENRYKPGQTFGEMVVTMQYYPFFRFEDNLESKDQGQKIEAMERQRARKVSDTSKGVLTVDLMRCTDLPVVGQTCDSYVELKIYDPDSASETKEDMRKTDVQLNEPSPRFRQKFDFVYISATSMLTITIYDKTGAWEIGNILKLGRKDDTPLGKVRLSVKDVAKAGRIKDAFPLQEAEQGDVHMALSWRAVEKAD